MDEALDLSLYAEPAGVGTLGMDLAVEGVACGACIARIEGAVKKLPGVTDARLNFTNRRLHVAWADGALKPGEIITTLEKIGYRGHPFVPLRAEQEEPELLRAWFRREGLPGWQHLYAVRHRFRRAAAHPGQHELQSAHRSPVGRYWRGPAGCE